MTVDPLPPIPYGAWLRATIATLESDVPADVPCGACNACCRTFHQIHLRPGENRARKRLPAEYLSAATGLPPGYLLLGYTDDGACPVLVGGRCTIYEDRPLVCRTYDCRMYAATGVEPDRADIAAQVRRWSFDYPSPEDRELHDAVLAAVRFIREVRACLPGEAARRQPIRVATLAVYTHGKFLPGATAGLRRRPVTERHRVVAVADANEELFGDG
ncbi:MAG TPA: YkgJ family cysteine cluster protein [Thermoleophilia bacterium]|nr:YkgJ family cysteine cluster protein [Thermoleophilia bacterium]